MLCSLTGTTRAEQADANKSTEAQAVVQRDTQRIVYAHRHLHKAGRLTPLPRHLLAWLVPPPATAFGWRMSC
jgi:hypothetical protein